MLSTSTLLLKSLTGGTTLRSKTYHCLHCCLLFAFLVAVEATVLNIQQENINLDPWTNYGTINTLILYFFRYTTLISLPFVLLQFIGLVFYNAFPPQVQLLYSPESAPFICFRTVTRGDYPQLVKETVQRNLECCREVGLKNFRIEVVTDKSINLPTQERVHEIVVPGQYRTQNGSLFKARALQYCLDDDVVNNLAYNDWIVHLDEETLMTVDSVRGILNFVCVGKHNFGQGVITYADGKVVNWITTMADTFRVGCDMANIRAQFKMFHAPLSGWKGSFMVNQAGPERRVSFDHGPDGSVTEDIFFALKAYEAGYTFDFIDGHMIEKSPFTISDFIKQRTRWLQGAFLIIHSKSVPIRIKWLFYAIYSLPLTTVSATVTAFFPIPCPLLIKTASAFMGVVLANLYVYGAIRCFMLSPYGRLRCLLCIFGAVLLMPFSITLEYLAVGCAIFSGRQGFYVVNKVLVPSSKKEQF